MANQKPYRLTRKTFRMSKGNHYRIVKADSEVDGITGHVTLKVGDVFIPTDRELELYRNRLELADELIGQPETKKATAAVAAVEGADEAITAEDVTFEDVIAEMSVNEVLAGVEAGRFSAEKALDAELDGKERKTLIAALEELV